MTICASPTTSASIAKNEENWSRALSFAAAKVYQPASRGEIVKIIKDAEDAATGVKWAGSFWSFTGVFVSNGVLIESDQIAGLIGREVILDHLPLADETGRESLRQLKGGTKVRNVNRMLHGLGTSLVGGLPDEWDLPLKDSAGTDYLALPTFGGSGGQSIAGALATGSHGGDVQRNPLADWVQAIHLIGPGGQEWWIERTEGVTAGSEAEVQETLRRRAAMVPDEMCDGIIVRKNDDIFRAVLVSVGRMGFVYSLVIKTVPAFFLEEKRYEHDWGDFSEVSMRASALEGYLAHKFFVQVLINPFSIDGGYKCRVAERTVVEQSPDDPPPERKRPKAREPFIQLLCGISDARFFIPFLLVAIAALVTVIIGLTVAAGVLFATATAAAATFFGLLLSVPLFALFAAILVLIAAAYVAIAAMAALITYLSFSDAMTTGDLLANITALFYAAGLKDLMKSLFTSLFESQYSLDSSLEVSWKIMDTYDYQHESFCEKVDSMEVAFDATDAGADAHLEFIKDVLKIFEDMYQRSVPLLGLLALRFMQKTESLIGMTKFPTTCHVEIPLIRNFGGNVEFLNRVQRAAIAHGGVPHWGQLMSTYGADDVQRLHGTDLDTWRTVLGNLIADGGGKTFTFSNNFTLTYNLEPPDAGLPDDCATGGPYSVEPFGTFNGPGSSTVRIEGDVTLDRVDHGYSLVLMSLHGSITLNQKVDNGSSAALTACGSVTIGEKVDQHSGAVILAHGDVVIGQGIDQGSHARIESTTGNITIGEKINERSHAELKANGVVRIRQKIDQHSQASIVSNGDVFIDQGIDQGSQADIESTTGNITIGEKINESFPVTLRARGTVHIGQKIDQHSNVTIVAEGDVVIDQGIDQHASVDITSVFGSILIGHAVDGNASAVLRAPNGVINIGEKVAGGASVQWAATSFSCPDISGGTVTPI